MDEYGTVVVERTLIDEIDNLRVKIRVARADPVVRIDHGVVDHLRHGADDAQVINGRDHQHFQLDDDVLVIRDDDGQRFVYRIDYADDDGHTYHAERIAPATGSAAQ